MSESEKKEYPKYDISHSRISTMLRCPMMYYYKYVEGIKTPLTGSLARGRAVHRALESYWGKRLEGVSLSMEQVVTQAAEAFDEEAQECDFQEDENPGKLKDQAVALTGLYLDQVAPGINPAMVEQAIVFPIELVDGRVITGYSILDLIDVEGAIHDNKNFSKTPSMEEADKNLQLTMYAAAYRHEMGTEESSVILDCLIAKTKPEAIKLVSTRTQADIDDWRKIVSGVYQHIESGIFYPNPTNMMCGPKNCKFFGFCRRKAS